MKPQYEKLNYHLLDFISHYSSSQCDALKIGFATANYLSSTPNGSGRLPQI